MLRIVVVFVAFVTGLILGAWAEYHFIVGLKLWLGAAGDSFSRSEYASTQWRETACTEAKAALEQNLQSLGLHTCGIREVNESLLQQVVDLPPSQAYRSLSRSSTVLLPTPFHA